MALDEALMESVRAEGRPVLRFYRWRPACLSLGRNQPAAGLFDRDEIARRGLDVVRRPTGGRAVVHARELTYSAILPERCLGTLRHSYARINEALLSGLRGLGVPAVLQPPTELRSPAPSISPCFHEATAGEVTVNGRKLIGSAQYRQRGVLLQHGSLLLADDQLLLASITLVPTADSSAPPAVLQDHLGSIPSWDRLTAALADGWRREVSCSLTPDELHPPELDRTEALRHKYSDVEWIWRR
jgi:lipoate-protein ligase A